MLWPVNPLGGKTINRRAGCGKSARPVRREGRPNPIGLPYPYRLRLLPSAGPVPWRPTRRQFLAAAAAGLAAWPRRAGRRPNHRSATPTLAAYDELMTRFMREHRPPGAALAVSYHGRLVYACGFGHADLERREPVRPASLFRIASISKPFTAHGGAPSRRAGPARARPARAAVAEAGTALGAGARAGHVLVRNPHSPLPAAHGRWTRDKSFDPMSAETAEQVAKSLKVRGRWATDGGQAQGDLLWLWLGRPAGRAAIRPLHQVAHRRTGGDFHAAGLPRRPHRLGRSVQHRRRSA